MRHPKCCITGPVGNIFRTHFITKVSQWNNIIINNDLSYMPTAFRVIESIAWDPLNDPQYTEWKGQVRKSQFLYRNIFIKHLQVSDSL